MMMKQLYFQRAGKKVLLYKRIDEKSIGAKYGRNLQKPAGGGTRSLRSVAVLTVSLQTRKWDFDPESQAPI